MTKGDTPERKAQWRNLRDRSRRAYKKDRAIRKFQRQLAATGTVLTPSAIQKELRRIEDEISA